MILVFGKSGQIGNELQSFENVHALDRSEADLSVPLACYDVVREYRPEAVINAAAYTNVDAAEDENIFDYDGAYDSFKKKVSFVYFFIFRIDMLSVHLSILLL